jgi:hypothetical protein
LVIAWSGHRPDVFRDAVAARHTVELCARFAAERWLELTFVCGGQRGVDQWAATAGLDLGVSMQLVLPTPPELFARGWHPAERAIFDKLLAAASSLRVMDPYGQLGPLAYDLRNEEVVRRAERLIVIWSGIRRGGTFFTVCAAGVRQLPTELQRLAASDHFDAHSRGI